MTDSKIVPSPDERLLPPPREFRAANGTPPDADLEVRDILEILFRRKWIIIGFVVLSLAVTGLILNLEKPIYRAVALIQLEDTERAVAGGLDADAPIQLIGRSTPSFLLSQLEILHSAQVLGKVVDREGLRLVALDNGFRPSFLDDVQISSDVVTDTIDIVFEQDGVVASSRRGDEVRVPHGAPVELAGIRFSLGSRYEGQEQVQLAVIHRERAISRLARDLSAEPREGTDVVEIDYTSADREHAARIVNTVVEAFRERNIEAARRMSQRRRLFLEEQLAQADSALAAAQQRLTEFRSRERVFSSTEWLAAQQTGLMNLDVRREELNANRRMYRSILDGLRGAEPGETVDRLQSLIASPEIAGNPVVANLFNQLIAYESERDSMVSGPWGAAQTNPDVTQLEEQIRSTTSRLETAARSHLETLDARVVALDGLRAQTSANLAALPEVESEQARLAGGVHAVQGTADLLRDEYQRARIAEAVEAGQVNVIDLATVPLGAQAASRTLKLILGLVLGLMLGGAGAFLRESLDTAIRRREELEGVLRVPGLGVVPRIGAARRGRRWAALPGVSLSRLPSPASLKAVLSGTLPWTPENGKNGNHGKKGAATRERKGVMPVADGRSAAAEAYRSVRTGLLFSEALHSLRTLLITSPSPAEGKTTTAANLAITFAEQGKRVLLVDADLRRPRLHDVFQIPRDPGLTQVILGRAPFRAVVRETDYGLHVLPAGLLPPNPAEMLGGDRMRDIIAELNTAYEFVIFDAAPLLLAADAAVLATQVDGSLLVVRAGKTGRDDGVQALHRLASVDARVVGAVLNDPDGSLEQLGGYYRYAYAYSGYYSDE